MNAMLVLYFSHRITLWSYAIMYCWLDCAKQKLCTVCGSRFAWRAVEYIYLARSKRTLIWLCSTFDPASQGLFLLHAQISQFFTSHHVCRCIIWWQFLILESTDTRSICSMPGSLAYGHHGFASCWVAVAIWCIHKRWIVTELSCASGSRGVRRAMEYIYACILAWSGETTNAHRRHPLYPGRCYARGQQWDSLFHQQNMSCILDQRTSTRSRVLYQTTGS